MTKDWMQKFIDENTMDGYMGEPAVGVEKVLELVAKVEAETIERCAKVCEEGRFLHDEAPDAIFGKACAKAIRALASPVEQIAAEPKCKNAQGVDHMVDGYLESSSPRPDCALPCERAMCPVCEEPDMRKDANGIHCCNEACLAYDEARFGRKGEQHAPSSVEGRKSCRCGREAPVCSSGWLADAHWKVCQNMVAGRPCAHPIACHEGPTPGTEKGEKE